MSRLEKIKNYYSSMESLHPDIQEDMKWLIQQAERVQELEEERDEWKNTAQSYYMTNQELREQNKRYRETLEEIKKEETVAAALSGGQVAYTISGYKARKALEGEK